VSRDRPSARLHGGRQADVRVSLRDGVASHLALILASRVARLCLPHASHYHSRSINTV